MAPWTAPAKRALICDLIQTHRAHSCSVFSSAISRQTLQTALTLLLLRKLRLTVGTGPSHIGVIETRSATSGRRTINPDAVGLCSAESTRYVEIGGVILANGWVNSALA